MKERKNRISFKLYSPIISWGRPKS